MININLENNEKFYTDFERTLDFLKSIKDENYNYPNHETIFHTYTEVKNKKQLMTIKSFLANQNLNHCKLIVWSDYDIQNNSLIQPYKKYVDFRVYNAHKEAVGTPLHGKNNYLSASDEKHYMQSGVLRFLVLYKYGGIWFDMDMVLLRNFKPILNQDFAYMWGSSKDFKKENPNSGDCYGPCAALMGAKKDGEHIQICMEELLKTDIVPCTTCFDEDMLAKVYRRKEFTVFPSVFFNTEWQVNCKYPGLSPKIQTGWFDKNEMSEKYLFLDAFAWHWHNTSRKNEIVQEGSKFNILEKMMDKKIKEKGLLNG